MRCSLPVSVNEINDKKDIANMFANNFSIKPMHVESLPLAQSTSSNGEVLTQCASDIMKVVYNMKREKSPGHDGLSVEHLLYASEKVFDSLALLFNLCIKHTYLPDKMLQTIVVPVVKNKTGDLSNISNNRPISLDTLVGKVLERLLQPELMKHVRISDAQFGFRASVSADSAILSVKHVVNYYKRRSTSVYACFLDLSRAFDLVNYNILWRKMHDSNVPGSVLGLLRYWYENQTNKVRWGDTTSSGYKLECGVRQGGLTSPDLFNLYVNGLIEELRSAKIGCYINGVAFNNLSYADDMVFLSPSINGLRKLISICENYARQHGLKYNESKTEMLVFRAGKGPRRVPPVSINGVQVRVVKNFRYLGHMLSESLSDDLDIERGRRALATRCNMLARRFALCSEDVKDQVIIYMALAEGKSAVKTGEVTLHTKTAIHIAELIAKTKFTIQPEGDLNIIECTGLGLINKNIPPE